MENSIMRIRFLKLFRVVFGFVVLLFVYAEFAIWHAVNNTYHRDTYDPELFWISASPWISLAFFYFLFAALYKWQSWQAGTGSIIASLLIAIALVLNA